MNFYPLTRRTLPSRKRPLHQLFRIMKLTALLITIAILQVSAKVVAQKVTLIEKQVSLDKVFKDIRQQTGYDFLIDNGLVDKAGPVTITVKNADLKDVLNIILQAPLAYEVVNKTVVVKQQEPSFLDNLKDKAAKLLALPANISGTIVDTTGLSLPGASVSLKGTSFTTTTDNKGNFTFSKVPQGAYTLIVTYIGFAKLERTIVTEGQDLNLKLTLHGSSSQLDQVQIVAYGETTQRYNTGAVTVESAKEIEQQPVSNPLLDLQARVPGLTVSPTSGAPGAAVLVQIRGQNNIPNINTLAYDQPLFIIDGVPFAPQNNNVNQFFNSTSSSSTSGYGGNSYAGNSPFNTINPLDIESITILKDADATSIYGSEGSNGVILINTKKGHAGKTNLNISVNTGPVTDTKTIQMMNTQQYFKMRTEAIENDDYNISNNPNAPGYFPELYLFGTNKNTNWFQQLYGGTAQHTDIHGSLSGGDQNTNFLISVGDGHSTFNFPGDFADDKYTLHSGFHHNSPNQRLSIDFGTDYSYERNNSSGAPGLFTAYTLPPNYPNLFDGNGNLLWYYKGLDLGYYGGNPYQYQKQTADLENYSLLNHLIINYKLFTGLKISSTFGYSRFTTQENSQQPQSSLDPAYGLQSSSNFGSNTFETLDIEPQIDYTMRIGKSKFSALLGGEYKNNINSNNQILGSGYPTDALLGSINGASSVNASDNYFQYKYAAIFGKLNYIWDGKYIFDLTGRRDGSSNFGPGKQFGSFGSISSGWIFSEENFFKYSMPFFSYGKLSVSYGTTGGDGITPYQYQSNWIAQSSYYSFQGVTPYSPANLLNPNYSWDTKKSIDAGITLGILKDKFLLSINLYRNRINNQLLPAQLPQQTGFGSVVENFPATVQNQGFELSLNTTNIKTKNFSWNSNFNISSNQNKLIAFPGLANSTYSGFVQIGYPTNEVYGFKYLGVNPTTGIFEYQARNGQPTYYPSGRFASTNEGDLYPIANLNPKYFGGLSNTFTYRHFSLMIFLSFSKQIGLNYIGSIYAGGYPPGSAFTNEPVQLLNAWQKPGDISEFQKFITGTNYNNAYFATQDFAKSSGAYSDASYIRLKTMSVSWNVPDEFTKKVGMHGASIYLRAQNLFTITSYQVLDPETPGLLYGVPSQRTIVAGMNLNF